MLMPGLVTFWSSMDLNLKRKIEKNFSLATTFLFGLERTFLTPFKTLFLTKKSKIYSQNSLTPS